MKWLVLLACIGLFACSSADKQICQEPDWYELGRREGAKGAKKSYDKIQKMCKQTDNTTNQAVYNNGYRSGLAEFCTNETAFELGRTGQSYQGTCPKNIEAEFTRKYQMGQRVRKLEQHNRNIDEKIDSIFSRLSRKSLNQLQKGSLRSELLQLKKVRQANEEEMSKLERKI